MMVSCHMRTGLRVIESRREWSTLSRVVTGLSENAASSLPENPAPIDYFRLFLGRADFERIAEETNRYADQELGKMTLKPHSRFRRWAATTWEEMVVFFAMILAMGLTVQQCFSEYWCIDEVTETPFFRKLMSRDRAYLLMSFFHLADNTKYVKRGQRGHQPLFKLGKFYADVLSRFPQVFVPDQRLSLDEGMIPWRGHLSFRVYSPDKPQKYGIKAYMICDAANGFCLKFKIYTGKSEIPQSSHGATYDLVCDMMQGFFFRGHILYMDNYYSSIPLFWDLWQCGVGATGTLKANRKGIPEIITDAECKKKGDTAVAHNKQLMIMKYHDRKIVHLLSTVEKAAFVDTQKTRRRRNGEEEGKNKKQ